MNKQRQDQKLISTIEQTSLSEKYVTSKKEPTNFIIKESFKGTKNLADIITDIIFSNLNIGYERYQK